MLDSSFFFLFFFFFSILSLPLSFCVCVLLLVLTNATVMGADGYYYVRTTILYYTSTHSSQGVNKSASQ